MYDLPEDQYYDGEGLKDLPLMYHYNPFTKELVKYDYRKDRQMRCARGKWDGEHKYYQCKKWRCRNCFDCEETGGYCINDLVKNAKCHAGRFLPIKPEGCNYESFDDKYVLLDENDRAFNFFK